MAKFTSSPRPLLPPFHLLFLFLFLSAFPAPQALSSNLPLPRDLQSLLSIKNALHDPLGHLAGWASQANSSVQTEWCLWNRVTCGAAGEVTALDLSSMNLSGTLPPELRLLTHLRALNLSNNTFGGPFQPIVFDLPSLTSLNISVNSFNGTFPPGVSKLRSLTLLHGYSNSFVGQLPQDIAGLQSLEFLDLSGSYFDGSIPASFGGLARLKYLKLSGNNLSGPIPIELSLLDQLQHLEIGYNIYHGGFPSHICRLSNLRYLDISAANLSGSLPSELGNLTRLEGLLLYGNRLSGEIPESISEMGSLNQLDLSNNKLSGRIPQRFSELRELAILNLMNNNLSGEIPEGIADFLNLQYLQLWNNSLTGSLPSRLGSNGKLVKVDLSTNLLSGPIPPTLCVGNTLVKLLLFSNRFESNLPPELAYCRSLMRLRIQGNKISGPIPLGFGRLVNLTYMDLSDNNFSGEIPQDLGAAPDLQYLNISQNHLGSRLPENIWSTPRLQIFSASSCRLKGKIPSFARCENLYKIHIGDNFLTGVFPHDVDQCRKLISINVSRNYLGGTIPGELASLPSIAEIDLSHNHFNGSIPSAFSSCHSLEIFNVSYNLLSGPVPSGAIFQIIHPSSFAGNARLCGSILGIPCSSEPPPTPKKSAGAIVWVMAGAFGIGLVLLVAGSRCFHSRYGCSGGFCELSMANQMGTWKLTAFQRLNFTAEDVLECLSMSEAIVGMGSTGTVYKAEMPGGETIAVKKLWGKQKETVRRRRGVLAEVDVLGHVRHRNIVRLLGCCSNGESTLLLYEYMPNGSLDDLLHGKNRSNGKKGAAHLAADWVTRYRIAVGVAQGICYLHHDCNPVIVHRDLKPSNILLDAEMEARIADFGVAKLIETNESMSVIAGSYGYIAPEYAYTLQVDEKSDIYSFGVVLMEVLTGKRSVAAEFGDGNSIVDWVRSQMKSKESVYDVLDENICGSCASVREEMMLVLRVALLCTSRCPADRPSMRDVISMLQEAKPKRKLQGEVEAGADSASVGGGSAVD